MLSISSPYKIIRFVSLSTLNFSLLILHFALIYLLSAGTPDTLWTRTFGGASYDDGNSVQETSDGGFIIAGTTISLSPFFSSVYILRTDPNGDTLWTKIYNKDSEDAGYSVQQTTDSGFIITGSTGPDGPDPNYVYLIRADSNGDTLWTKTFSGGEGYSVQQTSGGGFIVAGRTNGFDVLLIRTNSDGDTLWTKKYGTNTDFGKSVQQTSDGGFIITGYTKTLVSGSEDIYTIRTNSSGDTLWTRIYGGISSDLSYSVQQTNDGGFVIAGGTASFGAGSYDVYLIRINSNGDTLWTKTYGGTEWDEGYSVQETSDGGFIVAGFIGLFSDDKSDVYLIRTDENGDTLWTKTCGGAEEERGYSVLQTIDGGFIITGKTNSFGAGGSDVYLIRLDKDSTGIQQETPSNYIKPNNFIVSYNNGNISINYTLPYSTSVKLEAYDIKGKLVKVITDKFMHKGSYGVNWDSKRFGAGVYFIKLNANGSAVSKKFTIIK